MELLRNLFEGYPNLWGGGVAHSVLILSLVITVVTRPRKKGFFRRLLDFVCRHCLRTF